MKKFNLNQNHAYASVIQKKIEKSDCKNTKLNFIIFHVNEFENIYIYYV